MEGWAYVTKFSPPTHHVHTLSNITHMHCNIKRTFLLECVLVGFQMYGFTLWGPGTVRSRKNCIQEKLVRFNVHTYFPSSSSSSPSLSQMTTNGFRYVSAGCPSLREVVIDDMLTLSDSCVVVSLFISNASQISYTVSILVLESQQRKRKLGTNLEKNLICQLTHFLTGHP